MKEFLGTKGEWVFDEINMKIKGSGDIEGRTVIANVSPKMDFSRGMTTQCFNAKLISAAPNMAKVLKRYEDWEAKLILENSAWENEMPTFTPELFDEFLEIQRLRNEALNKAL